MLLLCYCCRCCSGSLARCGCMLGCWEQDGLERGKMRSFAGRKQEEPAEKSSLRPLTLRGVRTVAPVCR